MGTFLNSSVTCYCIEYCSSTTGLERYKELLYRRAREEKGVNLQ